MAGQGDDDLDEAPAAILTVEAPADLIGERLDRALAAAAPDLSRARLQKLIAEGRVSLNGVVLDDVSAKAVPGPYLIEIPPPAPAEPEAQDIPLVVLYEDADLIVLDKPAGAGGGISIR